MAKRIVEETLENGKTQFKVETNRNFFGFKTKWHVCTTTISTVYGDSVYKAIFPTLEEAQSYIGVELVSKKKVVFDTSDVKQISTVWHNSLNELPNNNEEVIVELNDSSYKIITYNISFKCETKNWKRWAYLNEAINLIK